MKHTAISDVSKTLLGLFRRELVPDIIEKPASIGLCSPDNKGDYTVGLYLYKIEQSEEMRISGRQNETLTRQKFPPIILDLHYMITPYFKGDVKFLAEEEQILLGKVIQVINDNANIESGGEPVVLELISPTLDDRQKIWNSQNPYITSVFMAAKAVILDSARSVKISRVTDVSFSTEEKSTDRSENGNGKA